jgi:hypothetical protein
MAVLVAVTIVHSQSGTSNLKVSCHAGSCHSIFLLQYVRVHRELATLEVCYVNQLVQSMGV